MSIIAVTSKNFCDITVLQIGLFSLAPRGTLPSSHRLIANFRMSSFIHAGGTGAGYSIAQRTKQRPANRVRSKAHWYN
jgi:hypothetical protein